MSGYAAVNEAFQYAEREQARFDGKALARLEPAKDDERPSCQAARKSQVKEQES